MQQPFLPEILAPAGNLFKLKTAVRYGADAVYIAGRAFGLRSAAENFSEEEIHEGCRYAHRHGSKVYVVLNGFLFDEELARLPPFLQVLEAARVDAVIVSDLGVVEAVRRHSTLVIHISTQASTLNAGSARFWKEVGAKRVVLGREVPIAMAAGIKHEAGIEVEMFTHGAMCMAYSGHCTISNYTAGRDSNRGGCIQSCRMKYSADGLDGHFLSSKDLAGVARMKEFSQHRIDSLKIEGRMKSPLYVATTTRAYVHARNALIDRKEHWLPAFAFQRELETMSHRAYTEANLNEKAGADSIYDHSDTETTHTHDYLGAVVDVRPDHHIAVLLKTPLDQGDVVDVILPNGKNIRLDTSSLRAIGGEVRSRLTPNRIALLPYHARVEANYIVRKRVHDRVGGGSARLSA